MAKTINIEAIGELIGEKSFDMNWFNYDLGGGFGFALNKKGRKGRNQGSFVQGIDKDINVQKVMELAKNGDFDEIAGFYPAIFMFFGEKFIDKVDFCDKTGRNRISRLVDNLKGPIKFKNDIYDFVKQDFDFLAFLEACGRNKKLNFDVKSAISVYKLQGDDAIFPILCQIFYINKWCDGVSVSLIDDLPIDYSIEISDFLSGCHFPVAVSPSVSEFKWENNQNGHFLYAKYEGDWCVLDVVGVGRVNLSNYALTNRLNYLGGGGKCVPYQICWNWGEIVDAYHFFESDLLVRDLRNNFFDHYWFNFGLNSKLNVEFRRNLINGEGNYAIVANLKANIPTGSNQYLTVRLNGEFVQYCEKKDICYSKSEIFDWFEIGKTL